MYTINNFLQNKNEIDFNIFNFKTPPPEKISIKINGNFKDNAYAKLKDCNGQIVVKKGEANFTIEEFGYDDNVKIYMNYDGIDNSLNKESIIKIKSNKNKKLLTIMKIVILTILIIVMILILGIILISARKKKRLEFRPF